MSPPEQLRLQLMCGFLITSKMKFSIIYDDLSIVRGNTEEDWNKAPTDGIQFIVLDNGQTLFDHEFYYFIKGALWQTNDVGPQLRRLGFKFGRTASDTNFEAARQIAIEELKKINHVS